MFLVLFNELITVSSGRAQICLLNHLGLCRSRSCRLSRAARELDTHPRYQLISVSIKPLLARGRHAESVVPLAMSLASTQTSVWFAPNIIFVVASHTEIHAKFFPKQTFPFTHDTIFDLPWWCLEKPPIISWIWTNRWKMISSHHNYCNRILKGGGGDSPNLP